jgi:hypothetical protein
MSMTGFHGWQWCGQLVLGVCLLIDGGRTEASAVVFPDSPLVLFPYNGLQSPPPSELQLLNELQHLTRLNRQWFPEMEQALRQARSSLPFAGYRALYLDWYNRIQKEYAHLAQCYEWLSRLYRTNSRSPLYPRIRDTYVQAKEGFDRLRALLAEFDLPEERLPEAFVLRDGRLTTSLTPVMSRSSPPVSLPSVPKTEGGHPAEKASDTSSDAPGGESGDIPEPETTATGTAPSVSDAHPVTDLLEQNPALSLTLDYLGTFDLMEMYLFRHGGQGYYFLYGWREAFREGEQLVSRTDPRLVVAGPFPLDTNLGSHPGSNPVLSAEQHLEQFIRLNPTPLSLSRPLWQRILEAMGRGRTYTRAARHSGNRR